MSRFIYTIFETSVNIGYLGYSFFFSILIQIQLQESDLLFNFYLAFNILFRCWKIK